ncbi:MAG: hypothetical protein ACK4TA_04005 [Saprospiraceae bacterium]
MTARPLPYLIVIIATLVVKAFYRNGKPFVLSVKPLDPSVNPFGHNVKAQDRNVKPFDPSVEAFDSSVKPFVLNVKIQDRVVKLLDPSVKPFGHNVKARDRNVKPPDPSIKAAGLINLPENSVNYQQDCGYKAPCARHPAQKSAKASSVAGGYPLPHR